MSLKSDKTISGNTAKEFLENLINFFHANTPELTCLESVSPGDSEYTGYPIYSKRAPVSGDQYINGSTLNDFKSPVYFLGTSVDNVVLMITLMGKWLSISMCYSLTAARRIGNIIDSAKLTKICALTNIVRGSTDVPNNTGTGCRDGLQYYTYKVHLDHSTDIYKISLQYINSDYSTCYRFRPLLASSSTPATYYDGEEQFSVIFTKTDKGVACALNLFENLNKNATNGQGQGSSFYPQGQLLYFSFNEPVEISERLYGKEDPWKSTDYIADEDRYMPQWAEFLASFPASQWSPYQFYQRIGLKHFVPAFADIYGPERARLVEPRSGNNVKFLSPKIARYYSKNDVNFRIMPSQFFLLPKMKKGEAFTRQIYVPCSQERGEIYLCYIPAAEESDMPKSGNIYEIGGKRFLCIYPGMCGLFARVG